MEHVAKVGFFGILNPFSAAVPVRGILQAFADPDYTWVVVNIRVPFWVPNIVRHLLFRVPKRDPNFDNHPHDLQPRPETANPEA